MDIKEVIFKKRELQRRITQFVENEVDNFKCSTGCNISDISINMEEITTIGKSKTFMVMGTIVKIDIDD